MPIPAILAGNDNDLIVRPFQEAFTGRVINDADVYCTLCEADVLGVVTGATNASPIVITAPAHGLVTGDVVAIVNVGGNGAARGTFTITRVDANHFSLDGSTGSGAYDGGGVWMKAFDDPAAQAIALSISGDGAYRGILPGTLGLIVNRLYYLVFYCLGAYRDQYSEVQKTVARERGGAF